MFSIWAYARMTTNENFPVSRLICIIALCWIPYILYVCVCVCMTECITQRANSTCNFCSILNKVMTFLVLDFFNRDKPFYCSLKYFSWFFFILLFVSSFRKIYFEFVIKYLSSGIRKLEWQACNEEKTIINSNKKYNWGKGSISEHFKLFE